MIGTKIGEEFTAVSANTIVVTTTAAVAAGDHIILCAAWRNNITLSSYDDNSTENPTWQTDVLEMNAALTATVMIASAYCPSGLPSGTVITITLSGVTTGRGAYALTLTDLATSSWLDDIGTDSASAGATTFDQNSECVTTQADDYLVAMTYFVSAAGTVTFDSPATGEQDGAASRAIAVADMLAGAAGTYNITGSYTTSGANMSGIAAYKRVSGAQTLLADSVDSTSVLDEPVVSGSGAITQLADAIDAADDVVTGATPTGTGSASLLADGVDAADDVGPKIADMFATGAGTLLADAYDVADDVVTGATPTATGAAILLADRKVRESEAFSPVISGSGTLTLLAGACEDDSSVDGIFAIASGGPQALLADNVADSSSIAGATVTPVNVGILAGMAPRSPVKLGMRAITQDDYPTVGNSYGRTEWLDFVEDNIILRDLDFRNDFSNIDTTSTPDDYPTNRELDTIARGQESYVQIHGRRKIPNTQGQSFSSGIGDVFWDSSAPLIDPVEFPNPQGIVQGDFDALIDGIGENYKLSGHPFYFCFQHEPADDSIPQGWPDKATGGAAWAAAFDYWKARWDAIGIPNLLGYVANMTNNVYDLEGDSDIADWIGNLSFVPEWCGVDAYVKSEHGPAQFRSFQSQFQTSYDYAISIGSKLFIGEVGMSDVGMGTDPGLSKSKWYRDMCDQLILWPECTHVCFQGNLPPTQDYLNYASNPVDVAETIREFFNDTNSWLFNHTGPLESTPSEVRNVDFVLDGPAPVLVQSQPGEISNTDTLVISINSQFGNTLVCHVGSRQIIGIKRVYDDAGNHWRRAASTTNGSKWSEVWYANAGASEEQGGNSQPVTSVTIEAWDVVQMLYGVVCEVSGANNVHVIDVFETESGGALEAGAQFPEMTTTYPRTLVLANTVYSANDDLVLGNDNWKVLFNQNLSGVGNPLTMYTAWQQLDTAQHIPPGTNVYVSGNRNWCGSSVALEALQGNESIIEFSGPFDVDVVTGVTLIGGGGAALESGTIPSTTSIQSPQVDGDGVVILLSGGPVADADVLPGATTIPSSGTVLPATVVTDGDTIPGATFAVSAVSVLADAVDSSSAVLSPVVAGSGNVNLLAGAVVDSSSVSSPVMNGAEALEAGRAVTTNSIPGVDLEEIAQPSMEIIVSIRQPSYKVEV